MFRSKSKILCWIVTASHTKRSQFGGFLVDFFSIFYIRNKFVTSLARSPVANMPAGNFSNAYEYLFRASANVFIYTQVLFCGCL